MRNMFIILLVAFSINFQADSYEKNTIKTIKITDEVINDLGVVRPRWTNRGTLKFDINEVTHESGDYFIQGSWEIDSSAKITNEKGEVVLDTSTKYDEGIIITLKKGYVVELENSNIELIKKYK